MPAQAQAGSCTPGSSTPRSRWRTSRSPAHPADRSPDRTLPPTGGCSPGRHQTSGRASFAGTRAGRTVGRVTPPSACTAPTAPTALTRMDVPRGRSRDRELVGTAGHGCAATPGRVDAPVARRGRGPRRPPDVCRRSPGRRRPHLPQRSPDGLDRRRRPGHPPGPADPAPEVRAVDAARRTPGAGRRNPARRGGPRDDRGVRPASLRRPTAAAGLGRFDDVPCQPGQLRTHYDIRFLVLADHVDAVISEESLDLAWCPLEQLPEPHDARTCADSRTRRSPPWTPSPTRLGGR